MLLSLRLVAVPRISSYPITIAMLPFAVAAVFGNGSLAYATYVFSTAHSGFITGVGAGTWRQALLLIMPVVERLFDLHRYKGAFALTELVPVAGYVVWRRLHCGTEPMRSQEKNQRSSERQP